jgi:glycosyltransferase involved in cell wall biosynthesis
LNDVNDDPFGRFFFLKILKETDAYDGIFICQDLGTITSFMEVLEHIKQDKKDNNKKVFKSIFYTPVDCPQLIYPLVKGLDFFDVLVTYTEFGRKLINGLRPELKVKVIPHGNSSKDFFPMVEEDIKKFRQEYFGENADKFIITNINRNQPRKDLPNTIFAFMEAKEIWKENLPKPFLYLHTHPKDPMGWDIRALMMQTNLVEDVDYKLLPKEYEEQGTETELVNKIYNASDVYLTTTLGEGWGLGFSEAAACKTPIVAPYSTSFIEMSNYGKNAYMLETLYPFVNETDNVIRQQTDIYEVAENLLQVCMDKCSNSKDLTDKLERSYQWSKKIEWSEVCKSWIEYFKIF